MPTTLKDAIKQTKPFPSVFAEAYLNIIKTADELQYLGNQEFKKHGLTSTQYNALRIVRGAGAEGVTCSEIGSRMVSRVPDMTRLLDRLEKDGFVERERQTEDRRQVKIRLTAKGAARLEELEPFVSKLDRSALGHIAPERLQTLNEILNEIRR